MAKLSTSFTERFATKHLKRFKPSLEILLATYSPLTLLQLDEILKNNFGKDYNTGEVANSLSEYFKNGIDQGPLEFYHQLFAEWLVNQTASLDGIYIQKEMGHHYIADYLLNFYEGRKTNVTFQELSELCAHFLHGKQESVSKLKRLASLKVSKIRGFCILHYLARKRDATKLLSEFMKQFNSVDILDNEGWTPAMYAVQAGNIENVKLFIDNKANLNYVVEENFVWLFALKNFTNIIELKSSMISVATLGGYSDIINLLIERGANIEKADHFGWKPLYLAVMMGHFKIAQLFIDKNSVQPDVISLHHAAARNHTDIVRLLLNAGAQDECLPCKSEDMQWCKINLDRLHLCICETALHAAVSRNNVEMVKLILQYDNTSVNCRHGSGRTALMEAFSQKNIQMVELLINAGANISAECESPLPQFTVFSDPACFYFTLHLYNFNCYQPACDGNRVIDFSFAYGLWKVMTPFISKGILNTFSKNVKWNLTTVAVIYDQVDFINATYGYKIEYIPNIETVLRYVAVCYSVRTLEHLLYSGDVRKFKTVYEDGKTLLHFATFEPVESQREVFITRRSCPKITHVDILREGKRLETVMLLTKVLISDINKQDKYGRTALHYAAVQVLPEVVKYLVEAGADWSVKDERGDTALEYALREKRFDKYFRKFLPCQWTSDNVFEVCQSTVFDELVSYLLRLEAITECDMRANNLLDGLVRHRLPLSLYSLFKSGLDVNCAGKHLLTYLNHFSLEMDDVLRVFKFFDILVHEFACGVPFGESVWHQMSYYERDSFIQIGDGDFFKPPDSEGLKLLNECYDKEGYLPIHRAAQGGNTLAFSWFIEIGVDITRKTKSGLTVLALATRWLVDHFYTSPKFRGNILKQILNVTKEKNLTRAFFQCSRDISPLHVAASHTHGLDVVQYIASLIPEQSLTCTNNDGIQPIYLVYLYSRNTTFIKESLLKLGVSSEHKLVLKYPRREVEYHLIYNMFYYTLEYDLRDMLNDEGLFKCPGINDLLPNKREVQKYIKLCSRRCVPSTFEASRTFSSYFPHLDIQNNISNPFSEFMDIAAHMAELRFHLVKTIPFFSMSLQKNLWRKVTKAHSCAFRCSCFEIMRLLQRIFTSQQTTLLRYDVASFLAKRMGWTDTSRFGDVRYRWPFWFLLKKALEKDNVYSYLQILNPERNFGPWSDW